MSRQRHRIPGSNALSLRIALIACPSLLLVVCFSSSQTLVSAASSANFGPLGEWLLHHITYRRSACRTTFSLRRPSEEELQRLFLDTAKPMEFNHDFVGMTNPAIHSRLSSPTNDDGSCTRQVKYASGSSISPAREERTDDVWIPDYFTDHSPSSSSQEQCGGWRHIRIRRTVGYGQTCYETLRDVILDWEGTLSRPSSKDATSQWGKKEEPWASIRLFNYLPTEQRRFIRSHSSQSTTALEVSSSSSNIDHRDAVVNTCFQIGGTLKKLVTISKSPLLGIWTYNPCQVIYDLVDERCTNRRGHGLTYSATAYATLVGHLLAGEERVSVAIHDSNGSSSSPSSGRVEVEVLSYSRATDSVLGRMVFPLIKGMQERFFEEQVLTLGQIAREQHLEQQRQHEFAKRQRIDLIDPQRQQYPGGTVYSSMLFLDQFVFPSSHQSVSAIGSTP